MSKKVAFHTLGCKLNFSETSTIARQTEQLGFKKVSFDQVADMYVINTCSVTENADQRFKTIVRQAHKKNPNAYLAAIGCYAQLKPEELAEVDGVDLVLGATEKFKLPQYLKELLERYPDTEAKVREHPEGLGEYHSCGIEEIDSYQGGYSIGDRTRAFLKVQDGCDYKCTYCTIPLARGVSRSDTLQSVLQKAQQIADQGVPEIVLTGVNIGDYGKGEHGNKKHEHTFQELVEALDQQEGISRLRISSIEPNLLSDETIDFVAQSKRFVPHFHVPLQSGSDVILRKMKRRYLSPLYRNRVEHIKRVMPDACIGVDVIVGFPGESDEEFLKTYHFLQELPVSYLHVFPYSERPNTEAAVMEEVVPTAVRAKRSKMLRTLSVKKRRQFYETQLGKTWPVLFEEENKKGYIHGFSPNYVKVRAPWNPALSGQIKAIQFEEIDEQGLMRGRFVEEESHDAKA